MTDLKGPNKNCENCGGEGAVKAGNGKLAICPDCAGVGVVPAETTKGAKELTIERGATHGDWKKQSKLFMRIVAAMEGSANYSTLEAHQKAALINIAQKISRILTGQASEPDHWDDISGYAFLGKDGHAE